MRRWTFLTCLFSWLLTGNPVAGQVVDGELRIGANLLDSAPVNLNGEWGFAWNTFVDPSVGLQGCTDRIHVPGEWTRFSGDARYGYGTFALRIRLPDANAAYALKLPDIHTAYRLYVNGILLRENGIVGVDEASSRPSSATAVVSFISSPDSVADVVLHVSNHCYPINSGIWKSIELGTVPVIAASRAKGFMATGLLIGCLVIMGAYHLGLFISRRKDVPSLLFSVMCLLLAYRELFSGEIIAFELFPSMNWHRAVKALILVFPVTLSVFAGFLHSLFPMHYQRIVFRTTLVVSTVFGLIVLLTPSTIYLSALIWFNLFGFMLGIYGMVALVRAGMARMEGAWLFTIGMVAMMFGLVHDTFVQMGMLSGLYIMPWCFAFLILMQSMVLAVRFTRSFFRVEELSVGLEHLNRAYERFVPKEFLQLLNKDSITAVQLGDQRQAEMTVLFADIIGFTTMAEKLTPQETFQLINWTLGLTSPVIRKHNGFIDKYIGDAIMAVFPGSPDDALRAALEMREKLRSKGPENLTSRLVGTVDYGIGIHTGKLILGTVGGDDRMEGTVISDAVNTAARVESLTRKYDVGIVVTDDVIQRLSEPEGFEVRFLDEVALKGKAVPVNVYEVVSMRE